VEVMASEKEGNTKKEERCTRGVSFASPFEQVANSHGMEPPPPRRRGSCRKGVVMVTVSVMDGYNLCIFAYGQSGAGKTQTMVGSEHHVCVARLGGT